MVTVATLYQFIFTTDEKPTVVYSIPDRIQAVNSDFQK